LDDIGHTGFVDAWLSAGGRFDNMADNKHIEIREEPMTLFSHSRLNTYENCPLKYKYQYVTRPDIEKRDSIEAFMGSRCHESLEKLYKLLINRKMMTREQLLDDFKQRWEKNWKENIYIVRKDLSAEDYFEQGIFSLEHYYDRYHPFDGDKTIAIEQRVEVNLDDGGKYRLQGFIDRLSEAGDGHYRIHDYKTERNFKSQEHFDEDRQLALYQIGLQSLFNDIISVELIWHYLIFDKEARSSREPYQLEKLKIDTIHLIQEIENATKLDEFPYNESALCDWCDYYAICPAKKHFHITEQLPPAEFKEDDGVKLVNRWVEVKQAMAELKSEKEQLEMMLYDYCQQLSVEVVRGSSYKLRVKFEPMYKARFSLSGDQGEKERFFQFIKERGLYEGLMSLQAARLNGLAKSDDLDSDLRQALLEFLVLEEGKPRFYLSKIRKELS
jgi:putative RecB family exonuclease